MDVLTEHTIALTGGSRVEEPHTRGNSLIGVPRDQKMLTGHLPRVIYHQVYWYAKIRCLAFPRGRG